MTNVEKLAKATEVQPVVTLAVDSATVTLHGFHGAVYTATGATPAEAAGQLLDVLELR